MGQGFRSKSFNILLVQGCTIPALELRRIHGYKNLCDELIACEFAHFGMVYGDIHESKYRSICNPLLKSKNILPELTFTKRVSRVRT